MRLRRQLQQYESENASALSQFSSAIQKIQYRGLGENSLWNAVASGAGALLRGLRRLQIGAEVPRALDDFLIVRQPLCLEAAQTRLDVIAIERLRQRRSIVSSLGHPRGDVGPRHEGRIANDGGKIGSSMSRTISRNCGANSRSAAARIAATASRRISGGGIEIECCTPF
jgi:hypothetical protein